MTSELKNTMVSRDYVDKIISSMIDALIVVNPDIKINRINRATEALLGYKEDELIGKPMAMLFAKEEMLFTGLGFDNLVKKGIIPNVEKILRSKQGVEIPVLFSGSVMFNSKGEVQGIVCVALDITERKQAEEKLHQTMNNLARFNRLAVGRELQMIKLKQEIKTQF